MTLDWCDETYGTGACTASGSSGQECYHTKSTCQDPTNYNKGTKVYKFCMNDRPLPFPGENIRPYLLKEPRYLPTVIDPTFSKSNIFTNAKVALEMLDEQDNDIGLDPYVDNRSYDAESQGTFWRKLWARNIYYNAREVVIKRGFLDVTEGNYKTEKFIIDQVDLPVKGVCKIHLKDPLKKADRVQVPQATAGKVTDNPLSAGATTVNCDDTSGYSSSGDICIDDETITYTGKTGTSFTGCTRGAWGTTAAQHSQDAKIQLCYSKTSIHVTDIVDDILQNEIGFASGDVDTAGSFADEKANWIPAFNFTGIITKPTSARKVLQELCEQSFLNIWWDIDDQKIKVKSLHPDAPGNVTATLNDDENIAAPPVIDNNEDSRLSRIMVYFNKKSGTHDDDKWSSYDNAYMSFDADAEDSTEHGEKAVKVIYCRWVTSAAIAATLAERLHRRYRDRAISVDIIVELKDGDVKTADIVQMTTKGVVKVDGSDDTRFYQIVRKQQRSAGTIALRAIDTAFGFRYGFFAPAAHPDYDDATDAERKYAYFGDANGYVNSGQEKGFVFF
jgi:hypothetical protein